MEDDLAGASAGARTWSTRLGTHLEAARDHACLRRVDLAARLGVSEEAVRLGERSAVPPSGAYLARLIPILALPGSSWRGEALGLTRGARAEALLRGHPGQLAEAAGRPA